MSHPVISPRGKSMLLAILLAASTRPAAAVDDYVFVDSFESTDCSLPLTCPTPTAGLTCIAGQLTDAATASPLRAHFNVGLACGGGAIGGPCDLGVTAHDALQFAQNPGGSVPLVAGEVVVDGCGRYRFANLSKPVSGFVTIATDDASAGTTYMLASNPHTLAANQRIDGATAIAARVDDVGAWGTMAGKDYANSGVLLLVFSTSGIPTAGVSVTGSDTARYFSDTDTQRLSISSTATSTGVDGAALLVGTANSATGGESGGCTWPAMGGLATTSVAGVVTYLELGCR